MNITCYSLDKVCGQLCIPKDLHCCNDGSYCTSGSICCDESLSALQIAGIVGGSVGCLLFIVSLAGCFFYWVGKKKLKKELEITNSLETVELSENNNNNESSIYIGNYLTSINGRNFN